MDQGQARASHLIPPAWRGGIQPGQPDLAVRCRLRLRSAGSRCRTCPADLLVFRPARAGARLARRSPVRLLRAFRRLLDNGSARSPASARSAPPSTGAVSYGGFSLTARLSIGQWAAYSAGRTGAVFIVFSWTEASCWLQEAGSGRLVPSPRRAPDAYPIDGGSASSEAWPD